MKKLLFIFLFTGTFVTLAMAQDGERIKERLRAHRVAIYTEVLQLTSKEAEGFWPVFNKFADERDKVQDELKDLRRDNLSDSEAEAQIKKHLELRQKEVDLEKELVKDLKGIIAQQKIVKLPEAERTFRQSVLQKAKERREERQNGKKKD